MECDICGKDYKNLKAHARMAHPNKLDINKVAEAIYEDVVKPLSERHGFPLEEWDKIDKTDYYIVAKKITG